MVGAWTAWRLSSKILLTRKKAGGASVGKLAPSYTRLAAQMQEPIGPSYGPRRRKRYRGGGIYFIFLAVLDLDRSLYQ